MSTATGDVEPKGYREDADKALRGFDAECAGLYATIGMYVAIVSPADGGTIIEQADKRGKELAKVCKKHPKAKAAVTAVTEGNDITALIAGEITLAFALLANHPATQARVVGGTVNFVRTLFRRGTRQGVGAGTPAEPPAQPSPTPTQVAQNPMGYDPPENRVIDGPLPVFHAKAQPDAGIVLSGEPVTNYEGFDTASEAARMAESIGLATG